MNNVFLDQAIEYSLARLKAQNGDIYGLQTALQTVVIVSAAQGVIDNGGLEYFYECDFNGAPPYSLFVEAYRRIGAESAAFCIERTTEMFDFKLPHLSEGERRRWLKKVKTNEDHEFVKLSHRICGDVAVWEKLAEYATANRAAFQI
jgi:hypothetical protein